MLKHRGKLFYTWVCKPSICFCLSCYRSSDDVFIFAALINKNFWKHVKKDAANATVTTFHIEWCIHVGLWFCISCSFLLYFHCDCAHIFFYSYMFMINRNKNVKFMNLVWLLQFLKNRHLMVRVGGGWDTLENYLIHHRPVEVFEHKRLVPGEPHDVGNKYLYFKSKYKSHAQVASEHNGHVHWELDAPIYKVYHGACPQLCIYTLYHGLVHWERYVNN